MIDYSIETKQFYLRSYNYVNDIQFTS